MPRDHTSQSSTVPSESVTACVNMDNPGRSPSQLEALSKSGVGEERVVPPGGSISSFGLPAW